ncbi:MAG: sigma factor-like helix-turn-helix DNA-binding protein, partial [Pseudomonadota bacterium]
AIVVETIVRIEATLDALPARARAVFLMSRLEGLGHRDIARRLGVSLSTVEKDMAVAVRHCYRARFR